MKNSYDCIVIGAGIAGVTASIYLKRYNLNVMILEKDMPGGIINKTSTIENYPGLINVDGPTLSLNLYNQIKNLNIPYEYGTVTEIIDNNEYKTVKTDTNEYTTKSIILATGRQPKKLDLENEDKLIGHGISYCAICDGPLYKNKEVCVIGGGNSALEEAIYLSDICKKVNLIIRNIELRADNYLIEKVENIKNIDIFYNSTITKIGDENNKLNYIEINQNKKINCDGMFIFIGFSPKTQFIEKLRLNNDNGYLIVDKKMQTSIKNICACGDIISKDLYQMVTAASEGAIAAYTIRNNLSN